MKIYVAAKFERQAEALGVGQVLKAKGHEVTAGWLHESNDEPLTAAVRDLADVKRADAIVILNQDIGGCGMWVEMGYALGLGKKVYLIGRNSGDGARIGGKRSVFHHIPGIITLETIYEFEEVVGLRNRS